MINQQGGSKVDSFSFTPVYLQTDERTNAVDYLRRTRLFVREALAGDLWAWKWVAIAQHQAVYCFAICAAQGTTPRSVQHRNGNLISFGAALTLCCRADWMQRICECKALILTDEQREALHLNQDMMRNNFEHFSPMLWSIELHGMSRVTLALMDVVDYLVFETGHLWQLDEAQRSDVRGYLREIREDVTSSELYANSVALERHTGEAWYLLMSPGAQRIGQPHQPRGNGGQRQRRGRQRPRPTPAVALT